MRIATHEPAPAATALHLAEQGIEVALLERETIASRASGRNDGQLLFHDQIIPGSTLLGYVNADHWAVALALEEEWPILAGHGGAPFPREVLFEALVLYVAEQLGSD